MEKKGVKKTFGHFEKLKKLKKKFLIRKKTELKLKKTTK